MTPLDVLPLPQCVDEDETLIRFAMACRRNGQRVALTGVAKKARAAGTGVVPLLPGAPAP